MMNAIDDMTKSRLEALREIERENIKVARAYNKRVKAKSFQVEDMVWKMMLSLESRDRKYGKWSPS
jgi:hypothetical protein